MRHFFILCLLISTQTFANSLLTLDQPWEFVDGDAVKPSSLGNNTDSDLIWAPVQVPGALTTQGFLQVNTTGWYRTKFDGEKITRLENTALILGSIQEADEVYLNGKRIGKSGLIAPFYKRQMSLKKVRVYPIAKELIRTDKNNELLIRIQTVTYPGGIVSGPIAIGEEVELVRLASKEHSKILVFETIVITLGIAAWLIVLLTLIFRGGSSNELIWLLLALTAILCSLIPGSLSFDLWGLTSTLLYHISYIAGIFSIVIFARYYHSIQLFSYNKVNTWLERGILASGLLFVAILFTDAKVIMAVISGYLCILLSFLMVVYLGIQTFIYARRGVAYAPVHFAGIAGLLLFAMLFQYIYVLPINDYRTDEIGLAFFLICLIIGYLQRAIGMRRRMKELSFRVFNIANEERRWISRELHDAIGQQLAALRLRLEIMEENGDLSQLKPAQSDLARGLKQMRNLMNDLNPAQIDKQGLAESIRHEVKEFEHLTKADIQMNVKEIPVAGIEALHLFRIFQQSFSNALHHGNAKRIGIELGQDGDKARFSIEDDGTGFDIDKEYSSGTGLGLLNLQERVDLIDGQLNVDSIHGLGTRITVEIKV